MTFILKMETAIFADIENTSKPRYLTPRTGTAYSDQYVPYLDSKTLTQLRVTHDYAQMRPAYLDEK
jgi:hypothetical protein